MSLAQQKSLESAYVMHTFGRSEVEFTGGHGMKLVGDDGHEDPASACAASATTIPW